MRYAYYGNGIALCTLHGWGFNFISHPATYNKIISRNLIHSFPSSIWSLLVFYGLYNHCLLGKRRQSLAQGGSNLSPLIGCPQHPQTHRLSVRFWLQLHRRNRTTSPSLCAVPSLSRFLEMASKLFPAAPRAGRQLFQQLPKSQCRAFSAGPQRCSDALAVVRIYVRSS